MSYFLLTNNPVVKEYVEKHSDYYIEYTGETIQSVISRCEELFMTGEYALAADPMGGRKARPFPYLTVILDNNAKASLRDWSRIADFSDLNSKRMHLFETYGEDLMSDYRVLDCSLTKSALNI